MLVLLGVVALIAAASMLLLREPMRVALALITTMTMLGGIYGLLGVHVLAAFQILIYVGAVMVFMVYVIMLLEVREAPGAQRFSTFVIPGVGVGALLLGVLTVSVSRRGGSSSAAAGDEPFSMSDFARTFLDRYWLEFELTTVFLVAAIIAALAVIRVSRRAQVGERHG
jgi:NADH-quinone oxidoreductase subunit J